MITQEQLSEYRTLARAHPQHRSAKIILKLIEEVERLRHDYSTAIEAAFAPYPMKGRALAQLKKKAGIT